MRALVDTTIWSLALRRRGRLSRNEDRARLHLAELVKEGRVVLLGIIRQEILSGIAEQTAFERVRRALEPFPDEPSSTADHERAAAMFNVCRARGVQGTPVDMLLCAVAERLGAVVFTTDGDFVHYARHLPIRVVDGSGPV